MEGVYIMTLSLNVQTANDSNSAMHVNPGGFPSIVKHQ